jgi:hypothetical protein
VAVQDLRIDPQTCRAMPVQRRSSSRRSSLLDNLEDIAEVLDEMDVTDERNDSDAFLDVCFVGDGEEYHEDADGEDGEDLIDCDEEDQEFLNGSLDESSHEDYGYGEMVTPPGLFTGRDIKVYPGSTSAASLAIDYGYQDPISGQQKTKQNQPTSLSSFLNRDQNTRTSFVGVRLSGSSGGQSISSAPPDGQPQLLQQQQLDARVVRHSISIPRHNEEGQANARSSTSTRRQQVYYRPSASFRRSTSAGTTTSSLSGDSSDGGLSIFLGSAARGTIGGFPGSFIQRRRSSRQSTATTTGNSRLAMAAAVDRLGASGSNSQWENVMAAASVVAASSEAQSQRAHIQFGQDDNVLVILTLLNITNRVDNPVDFTVDPVNAWGFPVGGGKNDAERQGPHSFILCSVTKVHFDEDERYYTVRRNDTGADQRADPQWMEQLRGGLAGLEAAEEAAKRTGRLAEELDGQPREVHGLCYWLTALVYWPFQFIVETLIPFLIFLRSASKSFLTNLIRGNKRYGCRTNITCINWLVLVSFIFLYIEPFTMAFLPAQLDFASAIVEM